MGGTRSLWLLWVAVSLLFAPLLVTGAALSAEAPSAQALCWPPDALAAKPDERAPHRLVGHPDTRPLSRPLAAFTPTPDALAGSIRRVKIKDGRKLIALTFDLCEAKGEVSGYDGAIIDTLRQNDVKATFFAGGKWLLDHGERAQQLLADPNFEIGNHNWSHANVRRLDTPGTLAEVTNAQIAYEKTRADLGKRQCLAATPAALSNVPQRAGLYRFPYGACNAEALRTVAGQGLLAIQWDVSMADPVLAQTGERIVKTVLERVKPGSIIIGHANGRGAHTNDALPVLIPELKKRGFEFVTVSELLAAGEPEISQECYDVKPGDVNRYDKPKAAVGTEPATPPAPGSG